MSSEKITNEALNQKIKTNEEECDSNSGIISKRCPLLSLVGLGFCLKEDCAWWSILQECCGITAIIDKFAHGAFIEDRGEKKYKK